MGKAALGKGMRDLLPKSVSIPEEATDNDKERAVKELETNIERYQAQGLDVGPLRTLLDSDKDRIMRGIEVFRENVKKLSSAQTILRSLEGYGYTTENESIMADIKNPLKADEVLRKVNRLKERMPSEPSPDRKGKDTPRTRVLKELKVASENFTRSGETSSAPDLKFQATDVDTLMDDLADLGSAFTNETPPEDEITKKLMDWEKDDIFIDRIQEILSESGRDTQTELARFSQEVEHMRKLRDRLNAIDPSGIEDSIQKVRIKLPYTYMATDVERDIAELEAIRKPAGHPAPAPQVSPPVEPAIDVPPSVEPETVQLASSPPVEEEIVPEPVKEEVPIPSPIPEPVPAARRHTGISAEELLEKAKGSYGDGNLDEALALFEEVLQVDPENSKARFMIRRITQKK